MLSFVRLALRRPYTAAIAALLIALLGVLSVTRMIVDIFPVIDIPVVLVVWSYPGLSATDMERRVNLISERAYSTTVNGISRIESQAIPGVGILKVYFQPGSDVGASIAQVNAVNSTVIHNVPPGMSPPTVIQYNAANVPVVQMTISSKTLPEQQLADYALNFIRIKLFTIPGLSSPAPFGGKTRQIMIYVDPAKLSAKGLSAGSVLTALQNSNVIVPAGTARIGGHEYNVSLNSSPEAVDEFKNIPIGVVNGVPVLLSDVGVVRDSYAVQNNIVHVDGKRATYLAILKHADASTLAVVDATRDMLPQIQAAAPKGMELKLDFDQSIFVRAAVTNVIREAVISSILVSLMILLFLGDWRSTVVVSLSIPLSIAAGLIGLLLTGQSINLMTLGGLALAIGLLVDNATVTIENIHRNQTLGKGLTLAILEGSAEVIQPLTVATLAICIVFFPVVLLEGPARFLFIPLAITVVLAMVASYILSFTVVPAFSRFILTDHVHQEGEGKGLFGIFERGFIRLRNAYGRVLALVLEQRKFVLICVGLLLLMTAGIFTVIGTDFFPTADVGIIKLHYRAAPGTRIEETERQVLDVERHIRQIIPAAELHTINDMIGVPIYYNLALVPTDNVSGMDAEILIQLSEGHKPSGDYMREMRRQLPKAFPGGTFYFQTADIVSQVLNFGLAAPLDVQINGADINKSYDIGRQLLASMEKIPGVVDAHVQQVMAYPGLRINVDRQRAAEVGLNQRDVANNMLTSLASSAGASPSFWLSPVNGVNYFVAVQMPLPQVSTVSELMNMPMAGAGNATALSTAPGAPTLRLSDIAEVAPYTDMESINHYTVQRVIDVDANVDGRDLGGVAADLSKAIAKLKPSLPATTAITIRGQNEVMNTAFTDLGEGLILAVILVYALLVVLFQSWVDPLIIMMAVPGALMGILWMLALTGTTINVESLMGAIMSVGISVSNSILVVSFANEIRVRQNLSALEAVIEAGRTRLRPILMTAMAMILGMIPMALGLGEAGEQNAPLGRAVIGGLLLATIATLFLVPIAYILLRQKPPSLYTLDKRFEEETQGSGAHASGSSTP
ncbi:MAG TPA: efflux RND transporter permease subunit [Rhizomicrobium sp.]|nr:efflux RND transporter permease subunit [Rhizomicrobium sp.]